MKKIKCNLPITSVRVGDNIVSFQGANIRDKTTIVSDYIASKLLSKKGYELVTDLTEKVENLEIKIAPKFIEKVWNMIKKFLPKVY